MKLYLTDIEAAHLPADLLRQCQQKPHGKRCVVLETKDAKTATRIAQTIQLAFARKPSLYEN